MAAIDHLPPNNPEAEESVLGSCLIDPDAINAVRGDLQPDDFYRQTTNGAIYRAMLAISTRGVPVDFTTLTDELIRRGQYDETGGLDYLSHLTSSVPTAVHVDHYAGIVARTAVKRRLIEAAGKIAALGYDDSLEAEDSVSRANELLSRVQQGMGANDLYGPEQQSDVLMTWFAEVAEGKPPGILTGFCKLDWLTGGLRKGGLYVIGAPTKVGKTAWMGSTILNIAQREGGRVKQLLATCEVSPLEVLKRFMAARLCRDMNEVERSWRGVRGEPAIQRLQGEVLEWLSEYGVTIQHRGRLTADQIRARASMLKAKGELDVVYVDYLQRLSYVGTKNQGREREVAAMAEALKTMAGELGVPVVVAVQCSRAAEYRQDKQPMMSDFRESGNIENEADVALALYRPAKWPRKDEDPKSATYGQILDAEGELLDETRAYLHVLANRHGEAECREQLVWMPHVTRYGSGKRD